MTDEEAVAQAFAILTAVTHGLDDLAFDLIAELDVEDLRLVMAKLVSLSVGLALGTDNFARKPRGTTLSRAAVRFQQSPGS